MTPTEFKNARERLGLTLLETARAMGMTGKNSADNVRKWERPDGHGPHPMAATLMGLFLDGVRTPTWPADRLQPGDEVRGFIPEGAPQ